MSRYILRRLVQSVFTVFGVMLVTFVLFRVVVSGDIAASYVNPKAGFQRRVDFLRKHKLDLPLLLNFDRRLELIDQTNGTNPPRVADAPGANAVEALSLTLRPGSKAHGHAVLDGRWVFGLNPDTPLAKLTGGTPLVPLPQTPAPPTASTPISEAPRELDPPVEETPPLDAAATTKATSAPVRTTPRAKMHCTLSDGCSFDVNLTDAATAGDVLQRINAAPGNDGKLQARISPGSFGQIFNSQFFWHMRDCLTFRGRSFQNEETLIDIIREKARYSLAITIPTLALGWVLALIVSSLVAYYRGRWIDHLGVFLSVLGMCIPFLAYMILGQWAMFQIAPKVAWGLGNTANIYVPITIAVVAGLGGSVRFYRTVFLNEIHQDYVRTARAKGVSLLGILFRHVLRNCMLPILTALVLSIPFLIMGNLLLEQFFGIPGLGDLMISSITTRDVPIITAMTFLTAEIYVIGLLLTDILYAVFDPRIRLH